ncbi:MAG: tetratricopeptide repeat protein, partial [Chloroflexi bacterium]|nr:tetratricopeptide repeat protein [Chloroflexota bacterium]
METSDLFICLFYRRWGFPTDEYSSGTEEEFETALQSKKQSGRPEIWLFFRNVEQQFLVDPGEQLKKVLDFKDHIEQKRELLYQRYNTVPAWCDMVKQFLAQWLYKIGPGAATPGGSTRNPSQEAIVQRLEGELQALRSQVSTQRSRLREEAIHNVIEATTLHEKGRLSEAERLYVHALDLDPDDPEAHNNLGNLLGDTGRPQEAEEELRKALALRPDYPEVHYNLGVLLGQTGRPQEAEGAYRKALALRPDYPEAHNNLGVLLGQTGRPQEAEGAYRKALALRPD